MQPSDRFFELIHSIEGYRGIAYRDQAGVWTIGYGTTRLNGTPVVEGMQINMAVAEALLLGDVAATVIFLNRTLSVPVAQHQFDALVSFVYNIGVGGWEGSTLRSKINAGKPVLESYFAAWRMVTDPDTREKKVSNGLVIRRHKEFILFNGGANAPASINA